MPAAAARLCHRFLHQGVPKAQGGLHRGRRCCGDGRQPREAEPHARRCAAAGNTHRPPTEIDEAVDRPPRHEVVRRALHGRAVRTSGGRRPRDPPLTRRGDFRRGPVKPSAYRPRQLTLFIVFVVSAPGAWWTCAPRGGHLVEMVLGMSTSTTACFSTRKHLVGGYGGHPSDP